MGICWLELLSIETIEAFVIMEREGGKNKFCNWT